MEWAMVELTIVIVRDASSYKHQPVLLVPGHSCRGALIETRFNAERNKPRSARNCVETQRLHKNSMSRCRR